MKMEESTYETKPYNMALIAIITGCLIYLFCFRGTGDDKNTRSEQLQQLVCSRTASLLGREAFESSVGINARTGQDMSAIAGEADGLRLTYTLAAKATVDRVNHPHFGTTNQNEQQFSNEAEGVRDETTCVDQSALIRDYILQNRVRVRCVSLTFNNPSRVSQINGNNGEFTNTDDHDRNLTAEGSKQRYKDKTPALS